MIYSKLLKIYVPTVIYGVNEEEEIVEILDSGYWNIFHNTQAHQGCSQLRGGQNSVTIVTISHAEMVNRKKLKSEGVNWALDRMSRIWLLVSQTTSLN